MIYQYIHKNFALDVLMHLSEKNMQSRHRVNMGNNSPNGIVVLSIRY